MVRSLPEGVTILDETRIEYASMRKNDMITNETEESSLVSERRGTTSRTTEEEETR